jgi:hypothetical protein
MRANSLALRLFLSATALVAVILLITGVVLSSLYRDAVERSFDRRLAVYLRTLVADLAAPEDTSGKFPQSLVEPLFDENGQISKTVTFTELAAHVFFTETGSPIPLVVYGWYQIIASVSYISK